MIRTHVVVDGSNIATEGRSAPSLKQLDEAVRAFIAEHPSEMVTVIVDATFGHRIDESERAEFDEAVSSGELITAPAGAIGRGDAFILQVADKADATILSNDSFQEFHGQYGWLFDEGRLMGGKPVPVVGWVFLLRSPVRGPMSRRSLREATEAKQGKGKAKSAKGRDGQSAKAPKQAKDPKGTKQEKGGRSAKSGKSKDNKSVDDAGSQGDSKRRKKPKKPAKALNEPLPFIEFVGAHPVGTTLQGEVATFSSHGAYVDAGGATCYVPLRLMGDPPPRSARDVLQLGSVYTFAVHAIDPPLRGIDLALVAGQERARNTRDGAVVVDTAGIADEEETAKTHTSPAALATTFTADQYAEEAPVTPAKKAAGRKRAAKKSTAKRSAKKAPARKAAKRAPAKKKATARKRTTKKAAKRAPAKKKATARKRTTKKAAKRAPAKKKATARKRTTKKAAKRAPAKKKATARKRTTKKAAKRAPAKKKATARKRTAKKATRRR